MGETKHGAQSAHAKACKKYKDSGRREINKAKKQAKIEAGGKIASKKTPKTPLMKWWNLLRNTKKSVRKPYVPSGKAAK